MLNISYKVTLAMLFAVLLLSACKEKEIYSNIPQIDYKTAYILSSSGKDSLLKLVFTFKDGDGDIGLNDGDTLPPYNPKFDSITNVSLNPYYFNCYVEYREMVNGVFKPYIAPGTTDTFQYTYRMPSLTPEGKHKAIRGDIELDVKISTSQRLSTKAIDTIQYSIYIFDRALNKSNKITTPPVYWRRS